jgi:hypothetical protein
MVWYLVDRSTVTVAENNAKPDSRIAQAVRIDTRMRFIVATPRWT